MKSVIVTWYDAYSSDDWYTKAELLAKLNAQPKGELTQSQGFLYLESEFSVVLIQSEQPEEQVTDVTLAGLLVIPRGMIDNIEVLKQ